MNEGWDQRKFDAALREYVNVSSKTLQVIINTKAYYIARQALWFTARADSNSVRTTPGGIITVQRLTKKGNLRKKRKLNLMFSERADRADVPLAVLLLQARWRKAGMRSVYFGVSHASGVRAMERAIKGLITSRNRSLGFIKSGWLPAIQILAPLSDKQGEPPLDTSAKRVGQSKGTATPAQPGFDLRAEIVNMASAIRDKRGALIKYGSQGLDVAFRDETASMWEYIERKMKPDAAAFNAANK